MHFRFEAGPRHPVPGAGDPPQVARELMVALGLDECAVLTGSVLLGIDPYTYLIAVLQPVGQHPAALGLVQAGLLAQKLRLPTAYFQN